jgi:hypothetical protein
MLITFWLNYVLMRDEVILKFQRHNNCTGSIPLEWLSYYPFKILI